MGFQKHALIFLINLVLTPLISGYVPPSSLVIAPHCTSKCGGIDIPYPFGIEEGCYYEDKNHPETYPIMRITCNDSSPKPILGSNIPILNISLVEAEIRLNSYMAYDCYKPDDYWDSSSDLGTFTIASNKNKFVATGCDTYAWFTGKRYGENYYSGCMTKCDELNDVVNDNDCNGVGCCQASIPDGVTNITTSVYSFRNHTSVDFNPCSAAYPVANDAFTFSQHNLIQPLDYYLGAPLIPVIYNWGIGTKNCSEAKKDKSCLCKNNTICSDLTPDQDGYRCSCEHGFSGNPYLSQGCKDIDECKGENNCEKPEYCHNTDGSFDCECPKGFHGNGTVTDGCISNTKAWLAPVIIT